MPTEGRCIGGYCIGAFTLHLRHHGRERQSWSVHSVVVDRLCDRHCLLILEKIYLTVHTLRTYWNVYYAQKDA